MTIDFQIRNGIIVDGSGGPAFAGHLDICGGRIAAVGGPRVAARKVVDAAGLLVCPGFIDAHTHADLKAGVPGEMEPCIRQGVTTCVVGNCGFSAFPVTGEKAREYLRYGAGVLGDAEAPGDIKDFGEYEAYLGSCGLPVNIVSHVGHGPLRAGGGGDITWMRRTLGRLLGQGAAGLSLGLIYAPGALAARRELYALARVAAGCKKPVVVHLRSEGPKLLQSVSEMLDIARQTQAHIHFSHHKVMGRAYAGKSEKSLAMLDEARAAGLKVSLDAYPYDAGCSTVMVLFPPWVVAGGVGRALQILREPGAVRRIEKDIETGLAGWENLVQACGWDFLEVSAASPENGRPETLRALGERWGIPPLQALIRVALREKGEASVTIRGMAGEDVDRIITSPACLIGSDGLFSGGGAHPRRCGAFARIFSDYVNGRKLLSPEQAVAKMTGRTARTFGMGGRGLLRAGYAADVAVFSQREFRDAADYKTPNAPAVGMKHVFVAGRPVLWNGEITGAAPGRLVPV